MSPENRSELARARNGPSDLNIASAAVLILDVALACVVGKHIWNHIVGADSYVLIGGLWLAGLLALFSIGVSVAACGTAWVRGSQRLITTLLLPIAPLLFAAAFALPY